MYKKYVSLLAVASAATFETDEDAVFDATDACGKCIRGGFSYCIIGGTVAPNKYSLDDGDSEITGTCV